VNRARGRHLPSASLIAIMLGRLRMPVSDCLREYETLGGKVFGKPRPIHQLNTLVIRREKYSAKTLQAVFRDVTSRRGERLAGEHPRPIQFPSKAGLCGT